MTYTVSSATLNPTQLNFGLKILPSLRCHDLVLGVETSTHCLGLDLKMWVSRSLVFFSTVNLG